VKVAFPLCGFSFVVFLGSQVRYRSELASRPSLSTAAPATAATSAAVTTKKQPKRRVF
jgi:hypothetical protein